MKNFYMTLLSNSSMDYYPENRTSSFTVQLPRYMYLDGLWEVALTEIQYPYTFSNVEEDQTEINLQTIDITDEFIEWWSNTEDRTTPPFEKKWSTHYITPGYYSDIKDIVAEINDTIAVETTQPMFFAYNERAHRVKSENNVIEVSRKWIHTCKLSPRLGLQLGFQPNKAILGRGLHAQHVVNSGVIPDKMLIYCDILEPQLFGDSWGKVLRLINTNAGNNQPYFGQACSVNFNVPQYTPVQQKHFESITIDIKDIEAKLMPFAYGTLTVKLHFRRNKEF